MRAAAVALVLIVGAAVVLWFGNMLNSWVLGGLMGGLAALLLGIPISLILFSFLSRRHDEWLRVAEQEQEEISLAQSHDYGYEDEDIEAEEIPTVYEAEVYELPPRPQHEGYEDGGSRHMWVGRNLPAAMYPRLPSAGQSQASASPGPTQYQRRPMDSSKLRQQPKGLPAPTAASGGKGASSQSQRLSPDRRMYYPGSPEYQGNVSRSSHQSAALRAARREAAKRQDEEDVRVLPTTTYNLKRLPTTRPIANSEGQTARPSERRTSRQLRTQTRDQYQGRPRRTVVDATSAQAGSPATGPLSGRQVGGTQTEPLKRDGRYPRTGRSHQKPQVQTGQVARNPQLDGEYFDPEVSTGSLKNPLVRRAPYMYEDDPLREELTQQLDPPIVRRSSRYEEEEQ